MSLKKEITLLIILSCVLLLSDYAKGVAQTQTPSPQTPAPAAQPREELDVPVSIDAAVSPIPVKGDDAKWYLVYNLFLWNWSFTDLTLKRVEIFDDARATTLARYDEKDLSRLYRFRALLPTPPRLKPAELRTIPTGRRAALFVGFTVDRLEDIPATLKHRFTFEPNPLIKFVRDVPPDPDGNLVLDDFRLEVSSDKPLVIGPPLIGGPWKCSGGIDNNSLHQHQTTLVIREGKARIPERFAIDFQKIDERGDILLSPFPDKITNEMFYSYRGEVVAVADGVVAFVRDGIPENVPQASGETKMAVPLTRETVSKNQVSIQVAKDRYAFYAHLVPGSIRVKVGERVRRGQVIGLVGNSGNAVGPHLHFHVSDRNSLNGSEGIPYVFESFDVVGRWPENYKPTPSKVEAQHHRAELSLQNRVVMFADKHK
jgi:hypothetical protein